MGTRERGLEIGTKAFEIGHRVESTMVTATWSKGTEARTQGQRQGTGART